MHSLADDNDFSNTIINSDLFSINSFHKILGSTSIATIYIEGDGNAWKSKKRISLNPTPNNPIGFKLALADSSSNIIYLARPCQYINLAQENLCTPEYWTVKRASEEVIQSLSHALDILKKKFKINSYRLVGFSGGATIATILSAIRNDVIDLRTVAGNLDIDAFSDFHNVSRLTGSINPVNYAEKLVKVPQVHYFSSNDAIVTYEVVDSYAEHLRKHDSNLHCIEIIDANVSSHTSGWDKFWANVSHDVVTCRE